MAAEQSVADVVRGLHGELIGFARTVGLVPEELPADVRVRDGAWGARALRLATERWRDPDGRGVLTVALGSGDDFASATVLVLPDPRLAAPAFSADLVAFHGRFAVAALDLPSGDVACEIGPARVQLAAAVRTLCAASADRTVPDWLDAPADSVLCLRRAAEAAAVDVAARAYLAVFRERLGTATVDHRGVAERIAFRRAYLERLRRNEREEKALGAMFGAEWARAYLRGVLFEPDLAGSPVAV